MWSAPVHEVRKTIIGAARRHVSAEILPIPGAIQATPPYGLQAAPRNLRRQIVGCIVLA
jgi:hypothetical protein